MKSNLEALIKEEILVNKGIVSLDENDVQKVKDGSDFLDGATAEGKSENLGELTDEAVSQIKDRHPNDLLAILMLKIRVAQGTEFLMEQLDAINDVFEKLGDDVSIMWGIEMDAPITNEIRICVLGGFKKK
jgi:cell division GTPase FtsZ